MKRQNFKLLLTMLMSMLGVETFAHDIEVKNEDGNTFFYVWTNNKTELALSYQGDYPGCYSDVYTGTVIIHQFVTYNNQNYNVTSIRQGTFENCPHLSSVVIPSSIARIGNYAFSGCSSLTNVEIPNTVTFIGDEAFFGCTGLVSVNIPNGLNSLSRCVFYGCSSLSSISIPNGVTSIGGSAFEGCSGLTSLNIPNSVTSIGDNAFKGCASLTPKSRI